MEATTIGDSALRGRDGPLPVISLAADPDDLSDAFLSACNEAGVPHTKDYNGCQYEGASYLQLSTLRGRRSSTATAYLQRSNRATFMFARARSQGAWCSTGSVRSASITRWAARFASRMPTGKSSFCGPGQISPTAGAFRHR